LNTSLNRLFSTIGISKQSLHQRLDRQLKQQSYEHQLLYLVYEVRADHPTMGARDMYYLLKPEFIGRDSFERFCKYHGLVSSRPVNFRRTTDSRGVKRFDNLTLNLELGSLNQLWVSDITYFEVNGRFYYLTFIMDAYSRYILGYSASKRLFTEQTTLPALKMALQVRKGMNLSGLILHSDGGGQYYDHEFLALTENKKIRNSMCEYPWENGKSERVNGVIKNNYLKHRGVKSYFDLTREVDRSIKLYNEKKPHKSLNRVSPLTFENSILVREKIRRREVNDGILLNSQEGLFSPSGCGKKSSGSNITQEY